MLLNLKIFSESYLSVFLVMSRFFKYLPAVVFLVILLTRELFYTPKQRETNIQSCPNDTYREDNLLTTKSATNIPEIKRTKLSQEQKEKLIE
jgi:hypothetical protein